MDFERITKEQHLRGIKNAFGFGIILGTMFGVSVLYAIIEMFK